jgi:hypothetical protein
MINYLELNLITSTFHAVIMFVMGVASVTSQTLILALKFSIGYNILDCILMKDSKMKNQLLFHHGLLISAAGYCVLCPTTRNLNFISLGLMSEITTPFLNIAWYYNSKKNKTDLEVFIFKLSSLLTFVLYIPFRLALTPYVSYLVFQTDCPIKLFPVCFSALNYYWFYKMYKKLVNMRT